MSSFSYGPTEYKPTSGEAGLGTFLAFGAMFLQFFVVGCGWEWFMVPLGAPEVGFWQIAGMVTLFRFARGFGRNPPAFSQQQYLEDVARPFIMSALSLFFLWLFWRMQ